jgi:hypothetical protein
LPRLFVDLSIPRSLPEALNNLASHYARVSSLPQATPTQHEEMILKSLNSPTANNSAQPKLDTDFTLPELTSVVDHLKKSAFFSDSVSPLFLRHTLLLSVKFSCTC